MLIIKAVIWRILIIFVTFFIAYFITRSLQFSIKILIIDFFIKTILYYGYDKIWQKYLFNRRKVC